MFQKLFKAISTFYIFVQDLEGPRGEPEGGIPNNIFLINNAK